MFADYLQKIMKELQLTDHDIADVVRVKAATVRNWRTGKTRPGWSRQNQVYRLEKTFKERSLSIVNKIVIV